MIVRYQDFLQPTDVDFSIQRELIVGNSDATNTLRSMISLAAGSDSPLLLSGPAGSGKELAARAVHKASSRSSSPFITINCSALSSEIPLEQIFGPHASMAGNLHNKDSGLIKQANGGTVYFSEIGDLPQSMQKGLLWLIDDSQHRATGIKNINPYNIRIIAANTQCLGSLVDDGNFRHDLYARLTPLTLNVPPLKHRRDDIESLIEHFLKASNTDQRFRYDRPALQVLKAHIWPGNIAELRKLVARACLLHPGQVIGELRMSALLSMGQIYRGSSGLLPELPTPQITSGFNLKAHLDDEESRYIVAALNKSRGVVQHAAELAGLKRTTFIEKMRRHGIKRTK
jgi:sigma-54 dependent transcriptional regulator, flagellar regulatory protein